MVRLFEIGLEPFREIMTAPEFRAVPKVLETPKRSDLKEDVKNLATLHELTTECHGRKCHECHKPKNATASVAGNW